MPGRPGEPLGSFSAADKRQPDALLTKLQSSLEAELRPDGAGTNG